MTSRREIDRRRFLLLTGGSAVTALGFGAGGLTSIAACGNGSSSPAPLRSGSAAGALRAAPMRLDLAGRPVQTWGYNGSVPGPEIRLHQGDRMRITLQNDLPDPTTVHWHGLSLPNPMDGVPDVTQPAVARGDSFDYEFVVPDAGSFMYHAHFGHQLDRGLYGAFVVESRAETHSYDREYTLLLDDWRDGATEIAHDHLPDLTDSEEVESGANPGPKVGGRRYPLMLVNGRPPADPQTFEVRSGERIRLRVMNVAADTGFRFAIGGHRMTITHTDGMAVEPVDVDALRLGMGERYDVLIRAANPGAWQIGVVPEAKRGFGRAVLRYGDASSRAAPPADARPSELDGRIANYAEMIYAGDRQIPDRGADRTHDLVLTTNEINGISFPDAEPLAVAEGEWVRVTMRNDSEMWHPMHLHGHHFRVVTPSGRGPLKDTMLIAAGETAAFEFQCTNPGEWIFHCHNHYHMEKGMARVFSYRA